MPNCDVPIQYKGKTVMRSALAKAHGIHPLTFRKRIVDLGWSVEDALSIPTADKKPKSIRYAGKTYGSVQALCDAYGINCASFRKRLSMGLTVRQAIQKPIIRNNASAKFVTVQGVKYSSMKEVAHTFGLSYNTLYSRLFAGWTLLEALNLRVRKSAKSDQCNGSVYLITNKLTGLCYVGLTTKSIQRRFSEHVWLAGRFQGSKLHAAIRAYGKSNFTVELIDSTDSRRKLIELEAYYIRKLNTVVHGYNSAGGNMETAA